MALTRSAAAGFHRAAARTFAGNIRKQTPIPNPTQSTEWQSRHAAVVTMVVRVVGQFTEATTFVSHAAGIEADLTF